MGAYGHKAKRQTTAATNYPGIIEMNGNFDFADGCVPPSLLKYSELRKWLREFKAILADNILNHCKSAAVSEEERTDLDVKMSKLTREQKREWNNHIHNDHQPYRPDCFVCINAHATGYQHKRRKLPGMYVCFGSGPGRPSRSEAGTWTSMTTSTLWSLLTDARDKS